jgi:UDP-N-acetylmuramate--alanine ligase
MTSSDHQLTIGPNSHIHIIGIAGTGMSAVARILMESGITVSGSDRQSNEITHELQRYGAAIYAGHRAENVAGATALFISSAVRDDNPEVSAARARRIPILTRREFFRYLLPDKTQIAVAGTHGKTTTTALIVHLLRETGNDPSYIVGGTLANTGNNAHVGKGSAFVVEADEYGGMFLGLSPKIAIVTNIEHDHPDIFPTIDDVMAAFRQFVKLLPDDGILIACADDPNAALLLNERKPQQSISYGFSGEWRLVPTETSLSGTTEFSIVNPFHKYDIVSPLAGTHNMLNVAAALLAVYANGVPMEQAIPALGTFRGTERRFEVIGIAGGVTVISDYAHHPTAIRATLQAARQQYGKAKLWAVWQPHTYSRSRLLADEFAHAFADADAVLITDIYAAREQPTPTDPTSADLARLTTAAGHANVRASGTLEATAELLQHEVEPGDVVIILSAGDAPRIGETLLQARQGDER